MKELYTQIIFILTNHKEIAFIIGIIIIIILGIIKIIFLLLNKKIKRMKVTLWTYIGTLSYIFFFIVLLFSIRLLHINIKLDLKKFWGITNTIDITFLNFILIVLIGIIILHIIFLIFSTILKILQFQVWKLYIFYRHKYYYHQEHDWYKRILILNEFQRSWSYQHFCSRFSEKIYNFAEKYKLKKLAEFSPYPKNWYPVFRNLVFCLTFVFLIIECYLNNFVIEYTKYYMFCSAIFVLWYKFSMFFQYQNIWLDQVLYEQEYCFPNIVYINVTETDEEMLELYKEKPYLVNLVLYKWKHIMPDIYVYQRYIYISTEDLALLIDDNVNFNIPHKYIYVNWQIQKGFSEKNLEKQNNQFTVKKFL